MYNSFVQTSKANELKQAGNQLFSQGAYQQAIQKYDQALKVNPRFPEAYLNKGLCCLKIHEEQEALSAFRKALSLKPNYTKALFNCAQILINQKQYSTAMPYISKALFHNVDLATQVQLEQMLETCRGEIGAQVHFGCLDLKYTEKKEIKILEYGPGLTSGFGGYDSISPDESLTEQLHRQLKTLGLPFYLAHKPGFNPLVSGHFHNKKALKTSCDKEMVTFGSCLNQYKGLYGSAKAPALPSQILLMNGQGISDLLLDDKIHFSRIMSNVMPSARPLSFIIPKSTSDDALESIKIQLAQAGYEQCVIKLSNANGGEGVLICPVADLTETFRDYFPFSSSLSRDMRSLFESVWDPQKMRQRALFTSDPSVEVMIESYESSKPLIKNDSVYDATMRVAFLATRSEDKISLHYLGAYWKLPPRPISAPLTREACISSYHIKNTEELRARSAPVDEVDQASVYAQLNVLLPSLLEHVWRLPVSTILSEEMSSQERLFQLSRIACHYAHQGQFSLAHFYIDQAIKKMPNHYLGYHVQGQIYQLEEKFELAIDRFEKAIARKGGDAAYYRLGESYYLKGDKTQASKYFHEAVERGTLPDKIRYFLFHVENPSALSSYQWEPSDKTYHKSRAFAQFLTRVGPTEEDEPSAPNYSTCS